MRDAASSAVVTRSRLLRAGLAHLRENSSVEERTIRLGRRDRQATCDMHAGGGASSVAG